MRLLLSVLMCALFLPFGVLAQNDTKKTPLEQVHYNENINSPLTTKELSQLQEVYGDYLDEAILSRPQRLKDLKNILRNRVEIVKHENKDLSTFPKLSQVELFTVYNKSLYRDNVFSPESFNPLKYQFNFYAREGETYSVEGTDYIIIIKSQYQL